MYAAHFHYRFPAPCSILLTISLILLISPVKLEAQDRPSVGLKPVVHEDYPQAQQLASTVEDILTTTLTLMKSYRFTPLPKEADEETESSVKPTQGPSVDNLIGGRIEEEEGHIRLSLWVYNSAEEAQTVNIDGSATSYFDIFELTDSLVLDLLKGFTDEPVSFASLAFAPRGIEREYMVFIDGNEMGRNLRRIDKIIADSYELRIEDTAASRSVFNETIELEANEVTEIPFRIPYLYPQERRLIEETDAAIKRSWSSDPDSQELGARYTEVFSFLEAKRDRNLEHLKERFTRLRAAQRKAYAEHRDRSVQELSSVPQIPEGVSFEVDGFDAEWEQIPEYILGSPNVPRGKAPLPPEESPGADIAFLKLALDHTQGQLYYLIALANGAANEDIKYHVAFHPDNMEYFEFVAKHESNGWNLRTNRWHRSEGATPFSVNAEVEVRSSVIEGRIDIREKLLDRSLEELISEDIFFVGAKTQGRNPTHDYEITRQRRIDLIRRISEPLRRDWGTRDAGASCPSPALETSPAARASAVMIYTLREPETSATTFVAERSIEIDGDDTEWSGIEPAVTAERWRDGNPSENYNLKELYLARDERYLYLLAAFSGERVPIRSNLTTELLTFADTASDGWRYMLEQRIEDGGKVNIHVRKIKGQQNVGETWFEYAGKYRYNEEDNLLEIAFPLKRILPYMREQSSFRARFRLSYFEENRFKESENFRIVLY